MRLVSTRNAALHATFDEVILGGTAPDGGLWVPRHIEPLPDLADRAPLVTIILTQRT